MAAHLPFLAALGLGEAAARRLGAYLDLLARWSERTSLTGARTPEERVDRLVAPVVRALPVLVGPDLIDVGSGNGSPGLVAGLLRPDLGVTLLEPRQRRWAFLKEAARAAGRPGIAVLRERHSQYAGPPAAIVTLRALRLAPAELAPLVAPGGRLVVFGRVTGALGSFREEPLSPEQGIRLLHRG